MKKLLKKKNFFFFYIFLVSCVPAGGACVPARHAKMPWLESCVMSESSVKKAYLKKLVLVGNVAGVP
jgi:hypothetical protein